MWQTSVAFFQPKLCKSYTFLTILIIKIPLYQACAATHSSDPHCHLWSEPVPLSSRMPLLCHSLLLAAWGACEDGGCQTAVCVCGRLSGKMKSLNSYRWSRSRVPTTRRLKTISYRNDETNSGQSSFTQPPMRRMRICFTDVFSVFFRSPQNTRQPFSGTAERIFMKLSPNDSGDNVVSNVVPTWGL